MPDSLELVYLDPTCFPRLKRQPAWEDIVADAEDELPDPRADAPFSPGSGATPEDLRGAFVVLARGAATDSAGAQTALLGAVRPDGKVAPPLVLVAGELRLVFDEVAALKAAITTATPFLAGDELLRAAVQAGKDALATPEVPCSPAVAESITNRIRDAFGRARRAVPAGYLEAQTERALAEQRAYQKRRFQGILAARAVLAVPGDREPMLVFVPEAALPFLPVSQRFSARLVAEVHPGVDHLETQPFALRVLALARVWDRRS